MNAVRVALSLLLLAPALSAQSPALSAGAPAAGGPRLSLDHIFLVLDSTTYQHIAAAPLFAGQFAGRADAATVGDGFRCSGVCLVGRHTYLELLGPANPPGSRAGDVGLVLASEQAGGLLSLVQRLTTRQLPFDTLTWMSGSSGAGWPSFTQLRVAGTTAGNRLTLAVAEYSVEMARRAKVRDSLPENDRSRDRFLAPYLAKDQLLAELSSATLAVPVEEIAKARELLPQLGVRVLAEGEGAVIQLPGFTLRLVPAWDRPGVRKLEFALARDALANPTYRFGPTSRLVFGPGRVATWEF